MLYQKFRIFEKWDDVIFHGFSMRGGGVSKGDFASLNLSFEVGDDEAKVRENYARLFSGSPIDYRDLWSTIQVHDDRILTVDEAGRFDKPVGAEIGVDGFVTDKKDVPIMVKLADCQGVLLFDPVKKVVSAVHSGWKGNTKNIVGKSILRMVEEFGSNPSDILAGVSASLGPCCAEFSNPYEELPEFMHKYIDGRHVDLWACTRDQLFETGVLPKNIEFSGECSKCHNDKYFSYRASARTGRMGAFIVLR